MLIVTNHCTVQRAEISLGVEMSAKSYFGKIIVAKKRAADNWLPAFGYFVQPFFGFDLESHGKSGFLSQKFFWVRKFAKNRDFCEN